MPKSMNANTPGRAIQNIVATMMRQRETLFAELETVTDAALWTRPDAHVWSAGEHLDHTRVLNRFFRRLLQVLWPFSRRLAVWRIDKPYATEINDVFARPGFPLKVGWLWPPRSTSARPATLAELESAITGEHLRLARFFAERDERLLGHCLFYDPFIGWTNWIQVLRICVHHDAHHFQIVSERIASTRS
jgi:hypothetical protein